MHTRKMLELDLDGIRVDTFHATGQEKGEGTVHGHASVAICSGGCTAFGSCGTCPTDSGARPCCY